MGDERSRQGDALLFAARKMRYRVVFAANQVGVLQQAGGAAVGVITLFAGD
jgi:hypothetical protein